MKQSRSKTIGSIRAFLFTACLVFTIQAISAFAQGPHPSDEPRDENPTSLELALPGMTRLAKDVWVSKVAPGLWIHTTTKVYPDGTIYPANGMVLETRRGSILVDTGWTESQTDTLLSWARHQLGKPLLRAVVTHAHEDRMGGIEALIREHVPVFGLALTHTLAQQQGFAHGPQAVPNLETKIWRDSDGFEVFYPGAGHARDNIVVYFRHQHVLFGGCLVKSITAHDLGNTADAILSEWPLTIERVRESFPGAKVVVPGHGTIQGGPLEHSLQLLKDHLRANSAKN
jgi:metallo-beta-lactamase class B